MTETKELEKNREKEKISGILMFCFAGLIVFSLYPDLSALTLIWTGLIYVFGWTFYKAYTENKREKGVIENDS